jgi:phosphohistidine phosphatase
MGVSDARCLFLLRHAKSSWDDPALADYDRPLAPRGRKAAKRMGRHLTEHGVEVGLVLCSSARRTRQTLELVRPLGEVRIEGELYGASAEQLLERLQRVAGDVKAVMLIGHNPAIQELTLALAAGSGAGAESKFPTGALATLTFTGPWRALVPGRAELTSFVRPRELA